MPVIGQCRPVYRFAAHTPRVRVGVSRVLSGSFSVNPWNVDCVVDAVEKALQLSPAECQARIITVDNHIIVFVLVL